MTKLNQVIALEKGVKASTERTVTNAYHQFQKPDLFSGLTKDYTPINEEDFVYPSESRKIVAKVPALVEQIQDAWTKLFDLTLTKDTTNQQAKADIVIDGVTLVADVPVSTLIFLEKRLVDLATIVSKLPVLDVAKDWTWDAEAEIYRATPVRTLRQKKVEDYVVVVPPTDKHPAQTAKIVKDVPEGHWVTQELSSAVSTGLRDRLLNKITALSEAVKKAREAANMTEVTDAEMGEALFAFLLGV